MIYIILFILAGMIYNYRGGAKYLPHTKANRIIAAVLTSLYLVPFLLVHGLTLWYLVPGIIGWYLTVLRGWGGWIDMGTARYNRPEIGYIDWVLNKIWGDRISYWRDYLGLFLRYNHSFALFGGFAIINGNWIEAVGYTIILSLIVPAFYSLTWWTWLKERTDTTVVAEFLSGMLIAGLSFAFLTST